MEGLAQAHGRLLGDGTIQLHFPPAAAPTPPPTPPSWLFSLHLGDGTVLFWAVIALVAIATVVVAARHLRFRRGPAQAAKGAVTAPASAPPAPLAVPRAALEEADVLAAAGRYGDAVHALLLRGVEAIGQRFPRALALSHTSRDIARLPVLPDATRRAFAGLAERTERAVFARTPLLREDWDACRAQYAALLPPAARS